MPSVHFSFIYIGKEDFTERQEDLFTPQVAARAGAEPIQSRSLFRVSHAGAGSQGFGPSSTACPGHRQGAGWEVEQQGHELAPIWDAGTYRG